MENISRAAKHASHIHDDGDEDDKDDDEYDDEKDDNDDDGEDDDQQCQWRTFQDEQRCVAFMIHTLALSFFLFGQLCLLDSIHSHKVTMFIISNCFLALLKLSLFPDSHFHICPR